MMVGISEVLENIIAKVCCGQPCLTVRKRFH